MDRIKQQKGLFKTMHDNMYGELFNYAKYLLQNDEDAEEVIQDVFIAIWNKRGEINFDDSIRGYIITAVKNKCINKLNQRKKTKIPLGEHLELRSGIPSALEQLSEAELKIQIFKAVENLPPKCRTIFVFSREQGKSYKEIAKHLDISVKTVENQMGIALKKLRADIYNKKI